MGADTLVIKKKHEWNPVACEEWMEKHRVMEGERGKGDGHQHGHLSQSQGYLSQSQ